MRLGPVSTSAEVAHREWLVTGSVNYPTDSTTSDGKGIDGLQHPVKDFGARGSNTTRPGPEALMRDRGCGGHYDPGASGYSPQRVKSCPQTPRQSVRVALRVARRSRPCAARSAAPARSR